MCSIIGTLAMGIIGFGWLLVSGRSRVPSPPARITAFMLATSTLGARATARPSRSAARAAGTYLARGVVPEHDAADREAPPGEPRRTRARRRSIASAPRNIGSANISASVPGLARPTRTSMRRAPASAERDRRRGDQHLTERA